LIFKMKAIKVANFVEAFHSSCYCTLAQCVFNRNSLNTRHKQRTATFPHRKPLPRSAANSTVTISTSIRDVSSGLRSQRLKSFLAVT